MGRWASAQLVDSSIREWTTRYNKKGLGRTIRLFLSFPGSPICTRSSATCSSAWRIIEWNEQLYSVASRLLKGSRAISDGFAASPRMLQSWRRWPIGSPPACGGGARHSQSFCIPHLSTIRSCAVSRFLSGVQVPTGHSTCSTQRWRCSILWVSKARGCA